MSDEAPDEYYEWADNDSAELARYKRALDRACRYIRTLADTFNVVGIGDIENDFLIEEE